MQRQIIFGDQTATLTFAKSLARDLRPGDSILLSGPVGAGKSVLARCLIQTLQANAGVPVEEVPSPTFTLVQTYDAGGIEVWHADLYRLGDVDELRELGLDEAFSTAICLVEWPELLAEARPASALSITLAPDPQDAGRRVATLVATDTRWSGLFARGRGLAGADR